MPVQPVRSPAVVSLVIVSLSAPLLAQQAPRMGQGRGAPGGGPVKSISAAGSDVADLSYPDSGGTGETTGVVLTRPRRFMPDGIYVWREDGGVWSVLQRGSARLDPNSTIVPDGTLQSLSAEANAAALSALFDTDPTMPRGDADELMQFIVTGDYVDFYFYISGDTLPAGVHIGSKGESPSHVPFRLQIRSVRAPAR